jgi:nitrite reductase (NO-forming)
MRDQKKKNTLLLGRADWHMRANAFVVLYLVAALLFGVFQRTEEGGEPNAIITWSDHFVSALLWARSQNRTRQMTIISLINLGIVGVLFSISQHVHWLLIVSATLIAGVIAYYLRGITSLIKPSLNKRFKEVIAFYQLAALMILLGITLGVVDAYKSDTDIWQPRITLAHLHANLLGWVGLTIVGTLVTLWPTVLRTQMHEKAITRAKLGLKFMIVGILGSIVGSLFNQPSVLAMSVAMYLVGSVITLAPAALLLRRRLPDRSSSWMLFSGVIGLALLLTGEVVLVLTFQAPEKILTAIEAHLLLIFTLWLLPILLGALTYLLPVVLGRGPASNRELESILNFGWRWRIFLLPLSSIFQILPDRFHNVGRVLTAIALGIFLILTMVAMRKAGKITAS